MGGAFRSLGLRGGLAGTQLAVETMYARSATERSFVLCVVVVIAVAVVEPTAAGGQAGGQRQRARRGGSTIRQKPLPGEGLDVGSVLLPWGGAARRTQDDDPWRDCLECEQGCASCYDPGAACDLYTEYPSPCYQCEIDCGEDGDCIDSCGFPDEGLSCFPCWECEQSCAPCHQPGGPCDVGTPPPPPSTVPELELNGFNSTDTSTDTSYDRTGMALFLLAFFTAGFNACCMSMFAPRQSVFGFGHSTSQGCCCSKQWGLVGWLTGHVVILVVVLVGLFVNVRVGFLTMCILLPAWCCLVLYVEQKETNAGRQKWLGNSLGANLGLIGLADFEAKIQAAGVGTTAELVKGVLTKDDMKEMGMSKNQCTRLQGWIDNLAKAPPLPVADKSFEKEEAENPAAKDDDPV